MKCNYKLHIISHPSPVTCNAFMEKNIKLIIEYEGTRYQGFQIQPGVKTIQGEIEASLYRIFQQHVKIYGAGRTDAGVHASGQVVTFKHTSLKTPEQIHRSLNGLLPDDIVIQSAREMDENFHARFSVKSRVYRYTILNRSYEDVFSRNFVFFYRHLLDAEAMNEACKMFIGTHDFSSFRASSKEIKSNLRKIFKFTCHRKGDFIISEIEADGFLYMMVRILMGTILQVGRGKYSPDKILEILYAKDRTKAGPTLPARGLCLVEVKY
ncbi:MAG: tRNA pseudouridine synthase A [bacterium ADurb.Bin363]|nr:MAG: tRNA pseudouridine synthase A [bacterium ADurb.Bin363]